MINNIGNDSKVHVAIIENHLIELYQTAVNEQRTKILTSLRQMAREKDSQGDLAAATAIDWAIDRLLRS